MIPSWLPYALVVGAILLALIVWASLANAAEKGDPVEYHGRE